MLLLQTGEFYSFGGINGDGTDCLLDKEINYNLVGQFIECVVIFWKNGDFWYFGHKVNLYIFKQIYFKT